MEVWGRLEPQVLKQALNAIDGGSDLSRWDADSKDYRKRRAVLDKLRAQLTSSQPPERRVRKRFRESNDWKTGELIAYRLLSGRFVVLRVIGHNTDKGGTSPICELLDWIGDSRPNESQLKTVEIRRTTRSRAHLAVHDWSNQGHRDRMTASSYWNYFETLPVPRSIYRHVVEVVRYTPKGALWHLVSCRRLLGPGRSVSDCATQSAMPPMIPTRVGCVVRPPIGHKSSARSAASAA